MRRSILAGVAVLLALLPATAAAEVSLQKVGDFDQPVQVTAAPGDGERLYVVEQAGTIELFRGGVSSRFADLSAVVQALPDAGAGAEEGLLSMAFAPDFATSRLLYVYFTDTAGNDRVEELRAPTGDAVEPASRRLVLEIPHPVATNHNGGQLQFGPDGLLYLAPGDGANGANARSLDSLLGKVLRIDPRGDADGEHTVPADNPFAGQAGARGEIWASGLRNPFRFSFDRVTGDLILGDVGEGTTEEINFLANAAGRGRGADFGWSVCEGSFLLGSTTEPCSVAGSVLPAIEKRQTEGYQSIIPGYVVRDPSLPSLLGRLVYGDYYVERPRSALVGAGGASDDRDIGPQVVVPALAGFGQDAGGCVYAVSRNGPVYRLVESDTRIPCPATGPGTPGGGDPGGGATGPSGGPTTPGGGPAPADGEAVDRDRPALRARAKRRQRVLQLGGAVAHVRCDEACRVTAGGSLRIGERRFALRRVQTGTVGAAELARVKPLLTKRARRALRRALIAGRRPTVRIRLRAHDRAGNPSTPILRTVHVRR